MKRINWQTRVLEQALRMHRMATELSTLEAEQVDLHDRAEIVREQLSDLEGQHLEDIQAPWDD